MKEHPYIHCSSIHVSRFQWHAIRCIYPIWLNEAASKYDDILIEGGAIRLDDLSIVRVIHRYGLSF